MAVLLIVWVQEEAIHFEGHLIVAAGVLEVLAQVDSPDGWGSQSRSAGEKNICFDEEDRQGIEPCKGE